MPRSKRYTTPVRKEFTEEEIQRHNKYIDSMSHYEMAAMWRKSPPGHIYFDCSYPFAERFRQRLFEHFGGFTPEISKHLGWN